MSIKQTVSLNGGKLTFFPPLPSTTLPVRVSTTLAWNHPPSALSSKLPMPPQMVIESSQSILSRHPQPFSPSRPAVVLLRTPPIFVEGPIVQNGSSIVEVSAIMKAPRKPARVPSNVIPPFVPGGTFRNQEVSRRGLVFERMPNSEEKVSRRHSSIITDYTHNQQVLSVRPAFFVTASILKLPVMEQDQNGGDTGVC